MSLVMNENGLSNQKLLKLIADENEKIDGEIKTNFKKIKQDKVDNIFLEKTFKAYLTYVNSEIEKKEMEMKNLLLLSKYLEKVIEMNDNVNCQDGGGYENKHYSNYRLIQGKHELGKINKQIVHIKHNLMGFE
jgi:hypothetical protein